MLIGDVISPIYKAVFSRIFQITPMLIKWDRAIDSEDVQRYSQIKYLIPLGIFVGLVSILLSNHILNSSYFLVVFAFVISLPIGIYIFHIDINALPTKGIKRADLIRYQNYNILHVFVVSFEFAFSILGVFYLINQAAHYFSGVCWNDFFQKWQGPTEQIFAQYPGSFNVSVSEYLKGIQELINGIQSQTSTILAQVIPKQPLLFTFQIALAFFGSYGIVFISFFVSHLSGTKKTIGLVFLPLLLGFLFMIIENTVPFPTETKFVTSGILVATSYLATVFISALAEKRLSVVCPNPSCLEQNEVDSEYCSHCGIKLIKGEYVKRHPETGT
jgi:hypothetical protein